MLHIVIGGSAEMVTRRKSPTGPSYCYSSCPGLALPASRARSHSLTPPGLKSQLLTRLILWEYAKNCDSCSIQETLTKLVSNEDRNSICLSWILLFQDSLSDFSSPLRTLRERGCYAGFCSLGCTACITIGVAANSQLILSSWTSGFKLLLESIQAFNIWMIKMVSVCCSLGMLTEIA